MGTLGQNAVTPITNIDTEIEQWYDFYLSDSKKSGYVCTLKLPEKIQNFWGLNDVENLLKFAAQDEESDLYLSLNAFEYGNRKSFALKQIRNVGIDLDIHNKKLPLADAIDKLRGLIFKGVIPNPNLLIRSGRGLQLIYSIENGASPKMAYMSRYITSQYLSMLSEFGADTQTTDVTRVLRMPNTVNQKNKARTSVEIWNRREFSLEELYDYCVPMEQPKKQRRSSTGRIAMLPARKGVIDLYSLNTKRKDDLERLLTLRGGIMEAWDEKAGSIKGRRNVFMYTYGFTVGLINKTQAGTLLFARQANERFAEPLPIGELERAVKSGYKDAAAFFLAFKENEYTMKGLPWNLIKPKKSTTVINELGITPEEMEQMDTLISAPVRRKRNTGRKREARRSAGVQPRERYLADQQEQTEDKLWLLRKAIDTHPNAKGKELAAMLGISAARVSQLKRKL